jgi:hypothetical protein
VGCARLLHWAWSAPTSRPTVPVNPACCPDAVGSMLPATTKAAARPPGRRPGSRPAGRRLLSSWTVATDVAGSGPPCRSSYRSQRPQLAGRQPHPTHPRGCPRHSRGGRRAAGRGLRPPRPAESRAARRHRSGVASLTPGVAAAGSTAGWSIRRWSRWTGACWWSWRSAAVLPDRTGRLRLRRGVAYEMPVLVTRAGDVLIQPRGRAPSRPPAHEHQTSPRRPVKDRWSSERPGPAGRRHQPGRAA